MKTVHKKMILEMKVSTHGFKVSTHRDRAKVLKMNDQESTHESEVSTHVIRGQSLEN